MKTFGERLIEARKNKGINQNELAQFLNVSPTCLYNWEKNKREPTVDAIKKICQFLEIDTNWLIGITEKSTYHKYDDNLAFSDDETNIIKDYRELNEHGKEYIHEQMFMAMNTYKKDVADAENGGMVG